ncbi:TPA: hypothetical protein MD163_002445 [Klebsiella aerogenes]|nr:hypothetical protein [Klebsiella aerogenes]
MKLKTISAALAVLLAGCASTPSQDKIDKCYYGVFPEGDYTQTVNEVMKQNLKDPYSAVIVSKSTPVKFWIDEPGMSHMWNNDIACGYVVTGTINAKNSYGAYIGEKPFTVFFNSDGNVRNITDYLFLPHGVKD